MLKIAISPDENPGDSGSVASDGTPERTVNLGVCYALEAALQRCHVDVWFDPTITYVERVARANRDGFDVLFVCAHNSSTAGESGTQFVFCMGGRGTGHQSQAADAVYAALETEWPGIWPPRRNDAVEMIYEACAFLNDTVYCEYLFMSPDDRIFWERPDYSFRTGEATAKALASVYGFTYIFPTGDDMFTEADRARLSSKMDSFAVKAGENLFLPGANEDTQFNIISQGLDGATTTVELITYTTVGDVTGHILLRTDANKPNVHGPSQAFGTAAAAGAAGPVTLGFINNGPDTVIVSVH